MGSRGNKKSERGEPSPKGLERLWRDYQAYRDLYERRFQEWAVAGLPSSIAPESKLGVVVGQARDGVVSMEQAVTTHLLGCLTELRNEDIMRTVAPQDWEGMTDFVRSPTASQHAHETLCASTVLVRLAQARRAGAREVSMRSVLEGLPWQPAKQPVEPPDVMSLDLVQRILNDILHGFTGQGLADHLATQVEGARQYERARSQPDAGGVAWVERYERGDFRSRMRSIHEDSCRLEEELWDRYQQHRDAALARLRAYWEHGVTDGLPGAGRPEFESMMLDICGQWEQHEEQSAVTMLLALLYESYLLRWVASGEQQVGAAASAKLRLLREAGDLEGSLVNSPQEFAQAWRGQAMGQFMSEESQGLRLQVGWLLGALTQLRSTGRKVALGDFVAEFDLRVSVDELLTTDPPVPPDAARAMIVAPLDWSDIALIFDVYFQPKAKTSLSAFLSAHVECLDEHERAVRREL